ncbi:MAG: tRNA uridine-5-carboxymethylaminomethyl(34) synthesis GTPase MnmE [Erysipelotrichaceae bacterium]|nr:tRNA uridine-5-carboxymethylaminomethyl(34) synthesis GTPase MnmE [Erysipelotrichaceae bacterium]MDY3829833.1 tRNA uridine-5-carboxymethylaminomethyl(34) synthesis GTPase MnmE [Erysipelotrichaceae bacterium]
MFEDTIAAISTSTLTKTAISIVRISGKDAFTVLNKIFKTKDRNYQGYRIYYGHIYDPSNQEIIDEVLVNTFIAPKSFTGENLVEINCHGGLYVTSKVLTLVLSYGARMALHGEFSKRAFLNGKIDLTQAEAINDLICADNKDSAKLAVNSLSGSISKMINPLINDLEQCIAHIEVNIDYPEYDDNGIITANEVSLLVEDWKKQCDKIINMAQNSLIIKEGIKTVIVGKPNVGKSSLLNALLQQDKAIVSDVAGTTRDLVEGDIHLDNVTLHLIDTAGIHDTENDIEQIGIKKSRQALSEAQLVIVLIDSSDFDLEDEKLLEETENLNRLVVYNKKDLGITFSGINISANNGDIDQLINAINDLFRDSKLALSQPVLTNERQIALMRQAKEAMESASRALSNNIPLDLINEDIQHAYRCLKEILGQYTREDLLDGIFSRFCVGK